VGFHNGFDDGQSKASAVRAARAGSVRAIKAVKDATHLLRGDSDPRINDGDSGNAACAGDIDFHTLSAGAGRDGIFHDVENGTVEGEPIANTLDRIGGAGFQCESHTPPFSDRAKLVAHLSAERVKIQRLA
jgi:hypothetical protein